MFISLNGAVMPYSLRAAISPIISLKSVSPADQSLDSAFVQQGEQCEPDEQLCAIMHYLDLTSTWMLHWSGSRLVVPRGRSR